MDVNEKIITSSTVQVDILNSNEHKGNGVQEEQEQIELGENIYEKGKNYQSVQEAVEVEEEDNKKQFVGGSSIRLVFLQQHLQLF